MIPFEFDFWIAIAMAVVLLCWAAYEIRLVRRLNSKIDRENPGQPLHPH